jgi:hypothetical protein
MAKLIFLVKMDGRPSFNYSFVEIGGKKIATISESPNSLSETKNSIQKCALIDVSTAYAWDVLAFDRTDKFLRQYFRGFLGVVERQPDSIWTKIVHSTVRKWARKLTVEQLPEGEDFNTIVGRSINYLKDRDTFETDSFLDCVVKDVKGDKKESLVFALRAELSEAGIAGQMFSPCPDSLPKKDRKSTYITAEGVQVVFEGDRDAVGIRIEDAPDKRKRIVITTNQILIKG